MNNETKTDGLAPALLLTSELAALLRLHEESVRRCIRQGRIRAVKAGRHWRVAREEYDRIQREGV